jgi:hypothetical protein
MATQNMQQMCIEWQLLHKSGDGRKINYVRTAMVTLVQ